MIVLSCARAIAQIPCPDDHTIADFNAGTTPGTYISAIDGGVILKPAAASEFSDLPPTSEWNSYNWDPAGSAIVSGGVLIVDGARFNSEPESLTFGPGAILEFVATFDAAEFQHIGFGGGTDLGSTSIYNNPPWAMFSTWNGTTTLYARTHNGSANTDIPIVGDFLGSPHRYKIEWTAEGGFNYYIDGALVHAETGVTMAASMRPAISDFNIGGGVITVDWIHVSPYASSGTFESRVFDGGRQTAWGTVSITDETPSNTTLSIDVRTGNTTNPNDGSWTDFTAVSNGGDIADASRYIQYRANLATTDASVTPVLEAFSISECTACKLKADIIPHDVSCHGGKDGSIKVTPGNGTPPYSYKLGPKGDYEAGGADSTFSGLKAKTYTIFVKDANGCVKKLTTEIKEPSAITLNAVPTNVSCMGGHDGSITVTASGGTGTTYQYKKGKNGSYSDPQTGEFVFSNLKAKTYKIFAKDENGCEVSTDVEVTEPTTACAGVSIAANSTEDISADKLGSSEFSIKVTPNPSASDFALTVAGNNKESVDIRVIDLVGKNIYKTTGPLSNLYRFGYEFSPGVYILEVRQGSKSKTIKIIKQ